MTKIFTFFSALCLMFSQVNANDSITEIDSAFIEELAQQAFLDSIDNSFTYQTGEVKIGMGLATIQVPKGFKYLDAEQSRYVLTTLWGNPPQETMGLLFKENSSPLSDDNSYVVEISYTEEGHVEDDDASSIDYDELLTEMQAGTTEGNKIRKEQGYPTMELKGWAQRPFYDASNKKLHWAKELLFEGQDISTLNYNIRVLGRTGYLTLNAIGDISVLDDFNQDRDAILASVNFNPGHAYADFDSKIDKVAAYGIGGLIAGKILAKVGFFALIVKFWKIIAIGAIALFAGIRKFLGGKKAKEQAAALPAKEEVSELSE